MNQRALRWSVGTSVSAALMLALGAAACSSGHDEAPPTPGKESPASAGIPSWATADRYAGRLDGDEPISVQVHLRLRNMEAARAELVAISDPENGQYGRFLRMPSSRRGTCPRPRT